MMEDTDASISHDEDASNESAEVQNMIETYRRQKEENQRATDDHQQSLKKSSGKRRKKPKKKTTRPNSTKLDDLKGRVMHLMKIFEERGLFVPPPESMSERGKVWSNRNYGADKKRQRKNVERVLLEDRIHQLELCLKDQHRIDECVMHE
mmetsp:Transcript_18619/g.24818  ORF Transcript_18619/g.24818 Transcript_18619/m.24818 type:complete len:150 (+) Transcript_18619:90-539(+)